MSAYFLTHQQNIGMRTFCRFITILLMYFCVNAMIVSCKPSASNSNEETAMPAETDLLYESETADHDSIKEFGLLKNVEDSGYPFFTLTIAFPERGFTETFNLNVEEVNTIDAATLTNSIGKYLSFEYDSEISNALIDLQMNGISLINEGEAMELSSDIKSITGILSNAAEETTGDLPGELYIQTEEEITEKFPFFITLDIVKANGKQVTGYYEQRTQNTITSITVKQ